MDDSDVEEPADEPAVRVNGALLDRLRLHRDFQADLTPPDSSKAIVLFKPVLPPPMIGNMSGVEEAPQVTELSTDDQNMRNISDDIIVKEVPLYDDYDDDAMEIEQI